MLILGLAGVGCAAYIAGRSGRPYPVRNTGAGQVLYYVDPMHPAYHSDKPGKAPDCGMDLEPVYASGQSGQRPTMSSGSIRLTPDQEQAIRLETETMHPTHGERRVHTVGRVMPDEALSYSVSAGADGWVRRVFSDQTGTRVKRGQPLAAFFSKDISASQQAYIYALESYKRVKQTPSSPADPLALATKQLVEARDDLRFLGMGDAQIEELGRTRSEIFDVDVTAPADGWILERHVAVGQRFLKGELLYRIANLERVWVLADFEPGDAVFEGSLGRARVQAEGLPLLEARVAAALPQFDEQGRTGRLRLEVNNSHGSLVPGMIVNVDLDIRVPPGITAHADAVIDSGASKHVFVAQGDGQYELREVETGWQEGDRVEIRSGLKAGERVVTSGAFLLDSESRMKSPTRVWKALDKPAQ
jgi:Cu(I)/Ag(I) efflux system membrane fusion protein